jgi:UTP--glucose-1-phosphate uridylyltransferase
MKIKKAVFPSAGLGTRFLPATKAIPKEMLPLVDKPLIQYCVEEAQASGIKEIIFITGRGKRAIEDHFDVSFELEATLKEKKKTAILNKIRHISEDLTYIYTRQKKALGLGHAVLCAKNIINNEPFAVFLGDDIIDAKVPAMKQMIKIFEKRQASILAVQRVPKNQTHMYGIIKGTQIEPGLYKVDDVVEKPTKNPPSNLAIIGRYILTPEIFKQLEKNKKGSGGEYQLTDAIKGLLETQYVYAYEFEGDRFDAGDKLGFLKANIHMGLKNKDTGKELKKFIKELVAKSS